jgi:hypothetical protein
MDFTRILHFIIFITHQSSIIASIISCPFLFIMLLRLDGTDTKRLLNDTLLLSLLPFLSLALILFLSALCGGDQSLHLQLKDKVAVIMKWIYGVGVISSLIPFIFCRKRIGYRIALATTQIIWLTCFSIVGGMAATSRWL